MLLVWAMNGAPLLPQHGFPLRLVVPGWYGMASVKWLDRIDAIDRPFDGIQQVGTYIYRQHAGEPGVPVTTMRVKSLMVPPGIPDWYSRQPAGRARTRSSVRTRVVGGRRAHRKVEVAVDGQWREAQLEPEAPAATPGAAGTSTWEATPGEHELKCRATDANGDTQPLEQRFDRGGFGNNVVHAVHVTVR